ncbi:hypothetical protein LSTR_LSTR002921 [Laodelphax striatellus]|uniref:Putative ionotropic receptor ligand binding domain-containing protein n=1 Tax=Laodelphax striatellus TaxID=195883 RepID=A0A482XMJ1_LAOST|nr:hypothetical protein LSTR_LSTR002921 [Laodelphax striatellus]
MKLELACMLACIIVIDYAVYASSMPMPNPLDERSLAACLLQIAHHYIHGLKHRLPVILLIDNDKLTDAAYILLSNLKATWMIQSKFLLHKGIYIILSSRINIFEGFKEISTDSFFIFVITDYTDVVELNINLNRMMRTHWRLNIHRSVVLVLRKNKIDAYTMKPFTEKHCGVVNEAVLLNSWNFSSQSFDKSISEFGSRRVVSNFHGCSLNAVVDNRPPESMIDVDGDKVSFLGPGAQVVEILERTFNFTTNVTFLTKLSQLDRFGYLIVPGKSKRIKEMIESGKVDFAFGIFSHGIYNFPTLHLVNAAFSECFTWAAACAIRSEPSLWDNYVNEFSSFTWLMIAVVFIIVFLVKASYKFFMEPKLNRHENLTVLFGMYRNFIGQPEANKEPSTRSRLFKIIWLQYCFMILSLYLSSLGSFMTIPLTGKNVETLEQILQLDLNVIGTDATFKIFNATTKEDINAKVAKRFKLIRNESFDEIIRIMVEGKKSAAFATRRIMLHYSEFRSDTVKSDRPICPFDKCTVVYNASPLLLKKNSYLKRPFHAITQKVFESGIFTRLWQIYDPETTNKLTNYGKVFEIEKLYGSLIAYFLGIALSFLTFCCEYIVKYLISPFLRRRRLMKLKTRLNLK